jgi:hypothetical protein
MIGNTLVGVGTMSHLEDSLVGVGYLLIGGVFTVVTVFIPRWYLIGGLSIVWLIIGSYVNDLGWRYGAKATIMAAMDLDKKVKRRKKK